ncbi:hypothetical protein FRC06_002048, partial [Ceratobasidium sp. 370]
FTALEIYDFSQFQEPLTLDSTALPLYILSHLIEVFFMIRFYVLSALSKITGTKVSHIPRWAMTGDLAKLQPAMWDFAFADYIIDDSRARKVLGDSPGLDTLALSKLLWGDDSEDEDEVEDHILTGNTTLVSGTWKASDDGTDNPDEAEVDGLIDTFDVGLPEHSFRRISSWRAGVVRGGDFDFVNHGQGNAVTPSSSSQKEDFVC